MVFEVEIRSLVSEEDYNNLLIYFKENSVFLLEDHQETHYLDCKEDIRICRTDSTCFLLLKNGKIHDEIREELEVKFKREDFEKMQKILSILGLKTKAKWFRKRHEFKWNNINVCLDFTKGYGYIIELEIMSNESDKDKNLEILKSKLKELNIPLTSKEEFNKKYNYYLENWKKLIL